MLTLEQLAVYGIDEARRDNLIKLADHLASLPDDYDQFDMGDYAVDRDGFSLEPGELSAMFHISPPYVCGTACCAVGHGPLIGIDPGQNEDDWTKYAHQNFIDGRHYNGHKAYAWCFSGLWCCVDNTPSGAAARIRWMLDFGLPPTADEQRDGRAPLCYKATKAKA